jgi:hypothetical protein
MLIYFAICGVYGLVSWLIFLFTFDFKLTSVQTQTSEKAQIQNKETSVEAGE